MEQVKEPRSECDQWVILFKRLWFAINRDFKKILSVQSMDEYCSTKCDKEKECKQKSLFITLMDEQK